MSHIARYGSSLMCVNQNLFGEAFKLVVQSEHGQAAQISSSISSFDEGREVRVWQGNRIATAIRTNDLPQGLGVYFDKQGKPVFVADKLWEAETVTGLNRSDPRFTPLETRSREAMQRLQQKIEQTYLTLAIQLVLTAQGYSLETTSSEHVAGGVIIKGVKH